MQNAMPVSDKPITLNDRLNHMLETLSYQCDRLESVLSRVNGTPQKIESAKGTAPRPTLSMQNAIESLETTTARLVELTSGTERIA